MNCENCKYPTLCKVAFVGSIVTAITAGWLYYRSLSKPSNHPNPSNNDTTNQPDVNM